MTPVTTLRNFKSLTKFTYVGLPLNMREQLTANRTYYVSTTGNDSNNGLTVGSPFLTIQKAVDDVCGLIDMGNYNVTIQLANGTYSTGITLKNYVGSGVVTIKGDSTTPTNVNLTRSSASLINSTSFCSWYLEGLRLTTTGTGFAPCIHLDGIGMLRLYNMNFGSCVSSHFALYNGSNVSIFGNYTISGGAQSHIVCERVSSWLHFNGTITLTGTPNFSSTFVHADRQGTVSFIVSTISGGATGKRFEANKLSLVCSSNGSSTFLPGNVAGTTASGGIYA